MSNYQDDFKKILEEKDKKIKELEIENQELKSKLDKADNPNKNENEDNMSIIYEDIKKIYIIFQSYIKQLEESKDNFFQQNFLKVTSNECNSKNEIILQKISKIITNNLEKNDDDKSKTLKTKIDFLEKENRSLKELLNSKEELIKIQKESEENFKIQLNQFVKNNSDLEMNMNKISVEVKVKEDEIETLLQIIKNLCEKDKQKFNRNLGKLNDETKSFVEEVIKEHHSL